MESFKTEISLSPLDQIRQVEAEITRQIAAARESAEKLVAKARSEAIIIKNAGKEQGQREGEARYKEIVRKAEEEARGLTEDASVQARLLKEKGLLRMEDAVSQAVNIVVGLESEGLRR